MCINPLILNHFNTEFNSVFQAISCSQGVSLVQSPSKDPNARYKNLQLKLLPRCGMTVLESLDDFNGGYFEGRIKFGGQGPTFDGLVFSFSLRECFDCDSEFQIDYSWFGTPKFAGKTRMNWKSSSESKSPSNELVYPFAPLKPFNGFSKYAILWNDNEISWYINDALVRTIPRPPIPTSNPLKLYISIADGTNIEKFAGRVNWSPSKNPDISRFTMEIEYLRICSNQ
jgi:beta-glucanase (GH16 family)